MIHLVREIFLSNISSIAILVRSLILVSRDPEFNLHRMQIKLIFLLCFVESGPVHDGPRPRPATGRRRIGQVRPSSTPAHSLLFCFGENVLHLTKSVSFKPFVGLQSILYEN
jgi:hypothetical protein